MFIDCVLYAENMILLCPSVKGLISMLDSGSRVANYLSLSFSSLTSACLVNEMLAKQPIEKMSLGSGQIKWVDSLQYLGVTLTGGRSFGFNCASLKQSFFAAYMHI